MIENGMLIITNGHTITPPIIPLVGVIIFLVVGITVFIFTWHLAGWFLRHQNLQDPTTTILQNELPRIRIALGNLVRKSKK